MLKTRFLWLFLFLVGCKQSSEEAPATTAFEETPNEETTHQPKDKKTAPKRLLHVVQRSHRFSSDSQLDYFRLILRGDSITAGQIQFTITTRDGQVIHKETFPAAALEATMVHEMEKPNPTTREREAYIIRRMEEFVQPQDFISPAISANVPPDTAYVTLSSWKEIRDRKDAIGFKYLLGKEDGRLLVFDPEKQKAVRYGSFGG